MPFCGVEELGQHVPHLVLAESPAETPERIETEMAVARCCFQKTRRRGQQRQAIRSPRWRAKRANSAAYRFRSCIVGTLSSRCRR